MDGFLAARRSRSKEGGIGKTLTGVGVGVGVVTFVTVAIQVSHIILALGILVRIAADFGEMMLLGPGIGMVLPVGSEVNVHVLVLVNVGVITRVLVPVDVDIGVNVSADASIGAVISLDVGFVVFFIGVGARLWVEVLICTGAKLSNAIMIKSPPATMLDIFTTSIPSNGT